MKKDICKIYIGGKLLAESEGIKMPANNNTISDKWTLFIRKLKLRKYNLFNN